MRLFFSNLKKYRGYLGYAPVSILKTEVANTYLNWLWWFLEPLLFMLTYTFVANLIFNQSVSYFPLFVFIGLNTWNYFDRCIKRGVVMMRKYRGIVTKTYVPKYIFVLVQMMLEAIKIAISYLLLIPMMFIWKVPSDAAFRRVHFRPRENGQRCHAADFLYVRRVLQHFSQ